MSAVSEDVLLSDADLAQDPTCDGLVLRVMATGSETEISCDKAAVWRKVSRHCVVEFRLLCQEHYEKISVMATYCPSCLEIPIPVTWTTL